MGMVSFFEALLVVPPRIFKLKNGKFAIKCVDNFVMVCFIFGKFLCFRKLFFLLHKYKLFFFFTFITTF